MLSGARSARETKIIGELLDSMKIVPLDVSAADRAANVRRALERKGVGIGMADSLIAGIVLHVGGALLTRNLRHFQRIEGSPLFDLSDRLSRELSESKMPKVDLRARSRSSASAERYRRVRRVTDL